MTEDCRLWYEGKNAAGLLIFDLVLEMETLTLQFEFKHDALTFL
jgi:hypothetical protein